jgi:hypothetical protein
MMSRNRYPGVKPFERSEKDLFFGRDPDIEQLYELILLEKLVTLFGKSGYGKSSLLNAGILPRFETAPPDSPEYFLPLSIRFGAYVPGGQMRSPVENIRQRLAEKLPVVKAMSFVDQLMDRPSLWQDLKKRQTSQQQRFLLIFDQFEELFTYPAEQQNEFKNQLAELLYVAIPQAVRDASEELPDQEYDRLVERLDVKAVFAIRSDRLSALDQLKDALPAILRIRYELKPLQPEQARMAIVEPAALLSVGQYQFTSEPFSYTEEALDTILSNLAGNDPESRSGIEAFQLQIICQYIERAILEGEIKGRNEAGSLLVTEDQLPDMSNIYEEYYRQNIGLLPAAQQDAGKLVIEEGLLLVNNESGEIRRLSVDGGALIDRYRRQGVNDALLDRLVNAFLLRRERNSTGGFNYEISHDTLIKPIAHSRQERRVEELRLANERKREEAEARAQQEAEKRQAAERLQEAAERGRRRALLFSYAALALLLIALGAVYFAWQQSRIANDRLEEVLQARAGEDFQKYSQLLKRAQDLETLYPGMACALYAQADSLVRLHDGTEVFAGQDEVIRDKLEDCLER